LRRLDPQSPLQGDEVKQLLDGLLHLADVRNKKAVERGVIELLRGIEIEHAGNEALVSTSPWQQFSQLALEKFGKKGPTHTKGDYMPTPANFKVEKEEWI